MSEDPLTRSVTSFEIAKLLQPGIQNIPQNIGIEYCRIPKFSELDLVEDAANRRTVVFRIQTTCNMGGGRGAFKTGLNGPHSSILPNIHEADGSAQPSSNPLARALINV